MVKVSNHSFLTAPEIDLPGSVSGEFRLDRIAYYHFTTFGPGETTLTLSGLFDARVQVFDSNFNVVASVWERGVNVQDVSFTHAAHEKYTVSITYFGPLSRVPSYDLAVTGGGTPTADLALSSFQLLEDTVDLDAPFEISGEIENIGSAPAPASTLNVYISDDAVLDQNDLLVQSFDVNVLDAGQSTGTFNRSIALSESMISALGNGDYHVIASLDHPNTVAESDENNNIRSDSLTFAPLLPDLIVRDLVVEDTWRQGNQVTATWVVENQGILRATSIVSRLVLYSLDLDRSFEMVPQAEGLFLTAGQSRTVSVTIPVPDALGGRPLVGEFLAWVDVDPDGLITETREVNNLSNTLLVSAIDPTTGTEEPDWLIGDQTDNTIRGETGGDVIFGAGGRDMLVGGGGPDVIVADGAGLFGSEESDQVFRLFNTLFGRPPGESGHQTFSAQIASGQITLAQLAQSLVNSPEFEMRYGDTATVPGPEFVTLLFNNVFGRDPTTEGMNNWLTLLYTGARSRADVAAVFSESEEHIIRTTQALDQFNSADLTDWAPVVYRMFGALFGREPGETGFAHFSETLGGGESFPALIENMMSGDEWAVRYGTGTTDEAFVQQLFQNVLQRVPAQAGLEAWANALAGGMSRAEAVVAFINTPEYVTRTDAALKAFVQGFGRDDVLVAGEGDNLLSGGMFSDMFVFDAGEGGAHTVTDFEAWDQIMLTGFELTFDPLRALTQVDENVVFAESDTEITFLNTAVTQFTPDTFVDSI